ncbi:MAG: DNA-processing protein DprA [Bryobacteraceae bacterium]
MSPSRHATAPAEVLLHWMALRLMPGLGTRRVLELYEHFGSPVDICRADASELESLGVPPAVAQSLVSGCTFEEAAEQIQRAKTMGVELVALDDARYPGRLREIYDPPFLLFVQGRVELLDSVMVAIVGSRVATAYGATVARRLGRDLAAAGVTVVSGMARGVDTAAHEGALEAGATAAVFGCGLDVIYPAENRKLAERIARQGLIVTEFPFGSPAHPQNFPIRNRMVSGLSEAVVVVEGKQYSGSLITARLALDQNREVFAVPGNITNPMSFGPNLLLKQGAQLVQSAEDILDGLGPQVRARLARQQRLPLETQANPQDGPMSAFAAQILALLSPDQPVYLDELIERLPHLSSSEIIALLFELEEAGRIRQLPGRCYIRRWEE